MAMAMAMGVAATAGAAVAIELRRWALALLLGITGAAAAAAEVLDLPTRPGVTQRLLWLAPAQPPKATLLLFNGGAGGLGLTDDGRITRGEGNFLVRTRQRFVDAGFAVALLDAPSDRRGGPWLQGFRTTPEHVADVKAAVAALRARGAPVWLVGTSRGTQSVAHVATQLQGADAPDGIVLTASVLVDRRDPPLPAMPLDRIRVPVVVVHHAQDRCQACPPGQLPALMRGLANARRKSLVLLEGGRDEGPPCEAAGHHGFAGIEAEAVAAITGPIARGWPDWRALWDFGRPELTEQRLRERLATAPGDEAIALQTQIARTLGLRRRLEDSRALLQSLQPRLAEAGAEAVVRWHLEWGRTWASAVHDRETLPERDRETARSAFRTAAERARAAGLDGLAADALHMLPFTTADREQDRRWNEEALAFALASPDPEGRRWEASLRHNLGWTLNELGRHAEALVMLQAALPALERNGASPGRMRVGHWMVAHTLRRLGRIDEALAMQQRLERENAAAGTPDREVFEELALLHRARGEAALAADYEARAKAP